MGSLKQGATYIYEHADGVTYAREFGSTERKAIGWDYEYVAKKELEEWQHILKAAETNPALQNAVEQCILLYNLSKDNGKK